MGLFRWLGPLFVWLALTPLGFGGSGAPSSGPSRVAAVERADRACAARTFAAPPVLQATGERDRASFRDVDVWDAADEDDGTEPGPAPSNDDVFCAGPKLTIAPSDCREAAPDHDAGLGPASGHARDTEYPPEAV